MASTTLDSLALLAIGAVIAIIVFLLAGAAIGMFFVAVRLDKSAADNTKQIMRMMARSNLTQDELRREVVSALSALDANRLHDASISIQHGAKKLDHVITVLNKVVFAAGMGDAGMGLQQNGDFDQLQDAPMQQQVVEYGPPTGGFMRPPSNTGAMSASYDAFAAWQSKQRAKGEELSGASFAGNPTQPLPDLDAAYYEDLSDEKILSDADVANVPGIGMPDSFE